MNALQMLLGWASFGERTGWLVTTVTLETDKTSRYECTVGIDGFPCVRRMRSKEDYNEGTNSLKARFDFCMEIFLQDYTFAWRKEPKKKKKTPKQ